MPSVRLTIANNAKQTSRSVLVLRLTEDDAVTPILEAAKKKLRLKKPSRLFLAHGGLELHADEDVLEHVHNDAVVLISCGEDYVGAPLTGPSAPARTHMISSASYIDPEAVKQLRATAALPGVVYAAGMPDLHPGSRFPIGASFLTRGCIYPPLIGGDIGCGMSLFPLGIPAESAAADPVRLAEKLRGLEGPWLDGDVQAWLAADGVAPTAFDRASLGTVGGGNHFAEIQAVSRVADAEACAALGLDPSRLHLLVHSGSRGLGQAVLAAQPLRLDAGTPAFDVYVDAHAHACRWARRNRDLIAHRVFSCVAPQTATADKLLDIWHNNVMPHTLTVAEAGELGIELDDGATGVEVWVHRKGAAPSVLPGQPLVIPGSRGAHTYILLPTGPQHRNAFSVAHGAGRSLPRSTAGRRPTDPGQLARSVKAMRDNGLGGIVVCEDEDLIFEEAPSAYKDVDAVVQDLVDGGLARVIAVMNPVVTYKVRVA